jgi:hypothetical protein
MHILYGDQIMVFYLFLRGTLGFEFRALHLLGRYPTTQATPLANHSILEIEKNVNQ